LEQARKKFPLQKGAALKNSRTETH
jgi:hypothetical protein